MTLNNVQITATIPSSGYAPGQKIPLEIDVNNKSIKNISEFKIELNKVSNPLLSHLRDECMTNAFSIYQCLISQKVCVYFDTTRKQSKKHKSPLTSVFIGGCPANTCSVHISEILVPPVPASDSHSSKILHITYELKVI